MVIIPRQCERTRVGALKILFLLFLPFYLFCMFVVMSFSMVKMCIRLKIPKACSVVITKQYSKFSWPLKIKSQIFYKTIFFSIYFLFKRNCFFINIFFLNRIFLNFKNILLNARTCSPNTKTHFMPNANALQIIPQQFHKFFKGTKSPR